MARTYRRTFWRRAVNVLLSVPLHLGLAPRTMRLLTVEGRRTGKRYTTPVNLVDRDGDQFLVSPYGEVSWVKNARASGEVELRFGRRRERREIEELTAAGSVPVLKEYWRLNPVTRPFFDAEPDDPGEAFLGEASRHPVFLLK